MARLSFKNRINAGFSIVFTIMLITTLYSIWQLMEFRQNLELVYEHPFKVSNSIREIQIEIYRSERMIASIGMTKTLYQFDSLNAEINVSDSLIDDDLKLIQKQYLGNKIDVDSLINHYIDWKSMKGKIYRYKKENKTDSLDWMLKFENHKQTVEINNHTKTISDFALNKTQSIIDQTIINTQRSFVILLSILFFVTILVIFISYVISKSINKPIKKFINDAVSIFSIHSEKQDFKFHREEELFDYTITELRQSYQNIEQQNEEIRSNNEQLSNFNLSLEEKVNERTLQLKESEEKFRGAFETSAIGMALVSLTGKFLQVNQSFCKMLDYENEELLLKTFQEITHPEDLQTDLNLYQKVYQGEISSFQIEKRYYDRKNKLVWAHISVSMVRNEANQPIYFVSQIENITLRKLTEVALRESNEYLENLFNYANAPIIVWDKNLNITRFNHAFEQLSGWVASEVISKKIDILFPKDKIDESLILIEKTSAGENWETVEIEILRKNKEIRTVLWNSANVIDNNNENIIATIAQGQDITDRKQAEAALKKSEEKFRYLVSDMRVGVLLQGPQTEMLLCNQAALELLGLTEDQLLGLSSIDPYWNVIHEDGSPFPGNRHPVAEAVSTKNAVRGVVMGVYRPTKQDRIWLLVDAIPELNDNGSVNQVICTFIDITERKQAEIIITHQNHELKKLNSDKDRFISILAHDLKGPFNTLMGFSGLLSKNIRNYDIDKIENQVNIIHQTAKRTYDLLDDILLWARAQYGKLTFEPKKLNFANICQDIANNMMLIADNKNITINYSVTEEIELFADINMLNTILRNLISNAIKFTNKGGTISISTNKFESSTSLNHLQAKNSGKSDSGFQVFSVSDNGVGIDPELLDNLFDISQTHSATGTADEKGTGLGLLLCKEFVEKHGGKIWAESELGKGSIFYFTLPLNKIQL